MKKLIFFLAMTLVLSACSDEKRYRIGVSQCSKDDWRMLLNDELEREVLFHNNVDLEILSADGSNEKQIRDLDHFAKEKYDIILVCPNEAVPVTPKIKELHDKGMPIIVFDRNVSEPCYSAYISADNFSIGQNAADWMLENVEGPLKVLEVYGMVDSQPAKGRSYGFHIGAGKEDERVSFVGTVIGDWKYEDASRKVDSLISAGLDFNVLFAHNDRMAIGASDAITKHGLRDKVKIIGIDAVPRIGIQAVKDGVIDVSFYYPTAGPLLMETAMRLLKDKEYRIDTILPSPRAVDVENAATILMVNSQLEGETRRMSEFKSDLSAYLQSRLSYRILFYTSILVVVLVVVLVFLIVRLLMVKSKCRRRVEAIENDYKYRKAQLEVEMQRLTNKDRSFGSEI